ncbi:hypothetical protein [Companilactobacillus ginsenosidimutans]|uniref:ABC transporter permease n=1 Tax=Companilactobacillus ginsenosidimutans TaxID=1007676 RepID=A0A0H4QH87_9LACO|nr:hypothetical protein [Companilactobacillus ginsenosidimutans]AKP67317.1 hypothetical protein ABM34_07035 [Companilactobacillus ginsenosidimutans]
MKFRLLFTHFSKSLVEDLVYPILLIFMVMFELMFNILIGSSAAVKFPSIIILNFFFAIILTMYFLKKDTVENKYLKQRVNNYSLYVSTQMLVMMLASVVTGIVSGIFTFLFSASPAGNGIMFLTLMTTGIIGSAIVFTCRSLFTSHKYTAAICLLIIVFFSLADSNNEILNYINWILPPISNIAVTFQEKSNMTVLFPLVIRQFVYSIILFVISGLFNKKNYSK